jgi:hypothetical protein
VSKYYQFYIKIIIDYSNQLISSNHNTAINIWDSAGGPLDLSDNRIGSTASADQFYRMKPLNPSSAFSAASPPKRRDV